MLYGLPLYDVPVIAIAYAWFLPHPVVGTLGLALMHFGLWCIYELGFREFDRLAYEQRENRGKVPPGYETYLPRDHASSAWVYAMHFLRCRAGSRRSGAGHIRVWRGWVEFGPTLALWAAFLASGRAFSSVYNRNPSGLRFLLYPWLHGFRFFG
jgi:hypothetical protein